MSDSVWTGNGLCSVTSQRPEYEDGARGGYVIFVCKAPCISDAAKLVETELMESGLILRGFEYLFDSSYMDRRMSDYEETLASRLDLYPVQFEDVHFFKPDS
ncbi:MAG: hypothetical protein RIE74_09405 [Pseudomonadales bacterium]